MDLLIHNTFLPTVDPEESLAFYRDVLGFEVRNDVGYGDMRWITVGPPAQPQTSIVLHPPAADPGITDDERATIAALMAKGSYASVVLATSDVDGRDVVLLTAQDTAPSADGWQRVAPHLWTRP